VQAFFDRLDRFGKDARCLAKVKVAAIGPATCRALESRGVKADFMPSSYTSASLLSEIKRDWIKDRRILLPRADIVDRELSDGLKKMGGRVEEIAVYRTVQVRTGTAVRKRILIDDKPDVITFTSASTVAGLLRGMSRQDISGIKAKIACIGPKTAEAVVSAGLKADIIAAESTSQGLVKAIEQYYSKET